MTDEPRVRLRLTLKVPSAVSPACRTRGAAAPRRKRFTRAATLVAVCSMVVVSLVVPVVSPFSPAQASSPPTINLSRPTAGISDPVASMTPFDRNCRAGQVDVNTASPAQISAAFAIPSGPTLDRVISSRPWLKAADVYSVPGVPTSSLPVLQQNGCATPTQQPEPAPQACATGTTAIDVQSATSATMASKLGLPRTTTDALVANRPLPQNLHLVATPRTPGLSDPTIDTLLAAKKFCVTPAPYTFGGVTWRWASAAGGAVITAAGNPTYALIVPSGVVSGPTGAWGTVTPIPGILPSASLHIYGTWAGEVGVRLPDPSPGKSVGVIHDTEPGNPSFSWGSNVLHETGGTIITAFHSLSDATAGPLGDLCAAQAMVSKIGGDASSLFCANDSQRDIPLFQIVGLRANTLAGYIGATPASGPCKTT